MNEVRSKACEPEEAAQSLLTSLIQRGVRLWLADGQLRFQAPKGALPAADLNALRELKPEVIALLERASTYDPPLGPRPRDFPVPLTAMQNRWVTKVLREQRLSRRWLRVGARLTGALDLNLLRQSLETLLERHEVLRTGIVRNKAGIVQQVNPTPPCIMNPIDLSGMPSELAFAEAMRRVKEIVYERIDIYKDSLFTFRLFKLSEREHVLMLLLDHLISDAFSKQIINRELWMAYRQAEQGLPDSLPKITIQFPDYAVWLERTRAGWFEKHESYWRGKFAGARRLRIPADEGLTLLPEPVGSVAHMPFGPALSAAIHDLASREQTFPSFVVLTAYAVAIAHWCRERDLVLTVQSNGRVRPELEHTVGYLTNQLFLRVQLSSDDTWLSLLKKVTREYWASHDHRDYDRVPDFVPECRSDLFSTDVYFNWLPESSAREAWQTGEKLQIELFETELPPPSRFMSFFRDREDGICLSVVFREDMLRRSTVEGFGRQLIAVAEELIRNPLARLAALP